MPSLSAVVKSASRRGRTLEEPKHELPGANLLGGNMLDLIGQDQCAGFQLFVLVAWNSQARVDCSDVCRCRRP